MQSATERARHESHATPSPASGTVAPDDGRAAACAPSLPSAIAIGLCVASTTPWIDLFAAHRVRRFGGEVFAVMAVYALVFAALWAYCEQAASTRSAVAFALRSVPFAMVCCGVSAATWICVLPSDPTLGSIAQFALSSVIVTVCAALVPVWVKPWLVVLVTIGVPLFATRRAVARRALSARAAHEIVAMCAIATSTVCAVLAWKNQLPASVATSSYAGELARALSLAAIVANALVAFVAGRAGECMRAFTVAFRAT